MEKEAFFGSSGHHQLPPCFLNLNWEQTLDQNAQFESALGSLASSPNSNPLPPVAAAAADSVVARELIGRLGSICNSGEISPTSHYQSTNNSCYSTPLNSPPKLNLMPAVPMAFSRPNPGFAERAARYSCFAARSPMKSPLMSEGPQLEKSDIRYSGGENGQDESSIASDPRAGTSESNSRKRKAAPKGKGKGKEAPFPAKANYDEDSGSGSGSKRCKSAEPKSEQDGGDDNTVKPAEPPKLDYIHVRARRGQATDSHSLAERVRREKISERMKFLQDLVPGCNKVTGKAVMLDEIINYVQSLQQQVEFLSMKLSTVNPRLDFNMDSLIPKDMHQPRGSCSVIPIEATSSGFSYGSQSQFPSLHSLVANGMEPSVNPLEANLLRSLSMQLPNLLGGFTDASASQLGAFWEDDLQSVVQMGFGQNQETTVFSSQEFLGTLPTNLSSLRRI